MKKEGTNNTINFKFADPAMSQFAAFVVEQFARIGIKLENHDDQFKKIDDQFKNHDDQFKKINDQFKKINDQFKKIDGQLKWIDGNFNKIDEQFRHVGILIEDGSSKIDTVIEGFNMHSEKLDLHTEMLEKLGTDVLYLKDVTSAHTDMIHETKDNMKDVKKELVQINKKLDGKVDINDFKKSSPYFP